MAPSASVSDSPSMVIHTYMYMGRKTHYGFVFFAKNMSVFKLSAHLSE